jgi:hypothetical protein
MIYPPFSSSFQNTSLLSCGQAGRDKIYPTFLAGRFRFRVVRVVRGLKNSFLPGVPGALAVSDVRIVARISLEIF